MGFKEEYDSLIHPIPTDSSYVFWFRISRELLGLYEDVVCGIVYIPPEYTVYSSVDAFSELENEYLNDFLKHIVNFCICVNYFPMYIHQYRCH